MSLTFGNVLRDVGRVVLFFTSWAISSMSFIILISLFFGVVLSPLQAFNLVPQEIPESISDMQGVLFWMYQLNLALSGLVGLRLAIAVVAWTYHKDEGKIENDIRHVSFVGAWLVRTTLLAFFLSFFALMAISSYLGIPLEPANYDLLHYEARYFLLAVSIVSGALAAISLDGK